MVVPPTISIRRFPRRYRTFDISLHLPGVFDFNEP